MITRGGAERNLRLVTSIGAHAVRARWSMAMIPAPDWLPGDPPRPVPALMTAHEAALYLRLTEEGRDIGDALESLEYLVNTGRIRPCRVGRHNRFTREELARFIHEQTEQYANRYSLGSNRSAGRRVSVREGDSDDHQG